MAIKNTRTSVSNTSVEKRLKSKLKEDYDSFLTEDDEELGLPGDDTDEVSAPDEDPTIPDTESTEDIELTPTQEEWMDTEVDALLSANLEGSTDDEFSLDENQDGGLTEDAGAAPAADANQPAQQLTEDDLSIEDTPGDVEGDLGGLEGGDDLGDGGETLAGDFTAEELNAIIDSPNSIDVLKTELSQNAIEAVPGDASEEGDLGMGADDIDLDEADNLMEAELADSLEDIGYEQGGQGSGGAIKDYDKFPADLDFKPTEHTGKAKVETNGTEWEQGSLPKGDDIKDMVKESVKKSKMLVKAAAAIVKLQEAYGKLKVENKKLSKVNGILAAVGEKLNKSTRKKISESFDKCKTDKEVDTLYAQVVKVITEKKQPTLNEAVQGKKATAVKTVTTKLNESKAQPAEKAKETISAEQKRRNFLMGIAGNEDAYFGYHTK